MSSETLQAIIGTAVIDSDFCQQLLVDPIRILNRFDLTYAERMVICRAQAQTLEDLAEALDSWLTMEECAVG
ncbi:MAG: hypothetical protein HY326_14685 [Chloroflexi bacterium]|nr:hypothetical protein [Chloroflexota bacterium]